MQVHRRCWRIRADGTGCRQNAGAAFAFLSELFRLSIIVPVLRCYAVHRREAQAVISLVVHPVRRLGHAAWNLQVHRLTVHVQPVVADRTFRRSPCECDIIFCDIRYFQLRGYARSRQRCGQTHRVGSFARFFISVFQLIPCPDTEYVVSAGHQLLECIFSHIPRDLGKPVITVDLKHIERRLTSILAHWCVPGKRYAGVVAVRNAQVRRVDAVLHVDLQRDGGVTLALVVYRGYLERIDRTGLQARFLRGVIPLGQSHCLVFRIYKLVS